MWFQEKRGLIESVFILKLYVSGDKSATPYRVFYLLELLLTIIRKIRRTGVGGGRWGLCEVGIIANTGPHLPHIEKDSFQAYSVSTVSIWYTVHRLSICSMFSHQNSANNIIIIKETHFSALNVHRQKQRPTERQMAFQFKLWNDEFYVSTSKIILIKFHILAYLSTPKAH